MSSGDINDQAPGGFRRPSSRHHPFHFHTQPYPHDPQPRPWAPAHQNPSSASTAPSPSLPAMPSDTLPLFSPNPLTSYPHPLGAWNATFPPTAQHPPPVPTQTHTQPQAFDGGTDDAYYPTGYNTDRAVSAETRPVTQKRSIYCLIANARKSRKRKSSFAASAAPTTATPTDRPRTIKNTTDHTSTHTGATRPGNFVVHLFIRLSGYDRQ
ncbi:hypothetical protein M404DRAFT_847459 [Pisolithus tinctorius Marx 270]|uniref:Uncharacterized protein n=1 Tax=Pisolithus tinctorius Marx 270 TaxID=870435 RepID=A0A0C3NSL8_PISTI|nr:hypothetical protein M404DRAFT_847459 [Pisolithus tinctorius Marx 270]